MQLKRSIHGIAAAVIPLLLAASAFALEWPVASVVVTGTFGEDRGDHLHDGIDIGGGAQQVHAVLPGELVFRYDEGADFTSLPRGIGSAVALVHDMNIVTVYCHLAPGSLGAVRSTYAEGDGLGVIGDSGHANGKHLHFAVYDAEAVSYVNPLAFLPPIADRQAPVVRRILLVSGDERRVLENGAVVTPGRVEVLAEVQDLREDVRFSWPMAPYSVALGLDGVQAARIDFDALRTQEGKTVVGASGASCRDLYSSDGLMRLGSVELRAGASRIRVSARDYAQNETVREVSFTVRE
jgi:hypothetical protein